MTKEAELNAEADKNRREEVEAATSSIPSFISSKRPSRIPATKFRRT